MLLGGGRLLGTLGWILQSIALATVVVYTAWLLIKTKPWRELNWTRRALRNLAVIAATLGAMFSVGVMLYDAHQYALAMVAVALIALASAKYESSARRAEDAEAKALATRDAMNQLLEQTAEQEIAALHQTQSTS